MPVNAPEESGLALARGAALAAANAPAFDASTVGPRLLAGPRRRDRGQRRTVGAAPDAEHPDGGRRRRSHRCASTDDSRRLRRLRAPTGRRRGPQAVPARRQRADVDLRDRRCRAWSSRWPSASGRPSISGPTPVRRDRPERRPRRAPVPESAPRQARARPAAAAPPPETIKAPIPVVQQAPAQPPRRCSSQPAPAPRRPPRPRCRAAPPPAPLPAAPVARARRRR